MPVYDYHCRACGADFTRKERIGEHGHDPVTCPKCRASDVERVITASYARTPRKS
jgi:putative FmdB family regulatory protein